MTIANDLQRLHISSIVEAAHMPSSPEKYLRISNANSELLSLRVEQGIARATALQEIEAAINMLDEIGTEDTRQIKFRLFAARAAIGC